MSYTIWEPNLDKNKVVIIDFWNKHHDLSFERKYSWIYSGNPFGKARVFLLKSDQNSDIVGMLTMFRREFKVGDKKMFAGFLGDLFIIPSHRSLGPSLLLIKKAMQCVDGINIHFLYTYPNIKSDASVKRCGMEKISNYVVLKKAINIGAILAKSNIPSIIKIITIPLMNLIAYFYFMKYWSLSNYYQIVEDERLIGDKFDEFWEIVKTEYNIIGNRNASFLRWKYLQDPGDENKIFSMYNADDNRLIGYIAYRFDDKSLEIRDILAIDQKRKLKQLLCKFIMFARKRAIENISIHFVVNGKNEHIFYKLGFINKKETRTLYCHVGSIPEDIKAILYNRSNWLLFFADRDT